MKTFITCCFLSLALAGFSQTTTVKTKVAVPLVLKTVKVSTVKLDKLDPSIVGQYEITKFKAISRKTLPEKELKLLVGTLVKVDEQAITGSEIDPYDFEIFEISKMNSSDYIYREFDEVLKNPEPELPETVHIHKTGNSDYYGIVQIDNKKIVIPYKGVLLYLTRK